MNWQFLKLFQLTFSCLTVEIFFHLFCKLTTFMHNLHGWPCMICNFFSRSFISCLFFLFCFVLYFSESERDHDREGISSDCSRPSGLTLNDLQSVGSNIQRPRFSSRLPLKSHRYWFIKNPFVKPPPTYSLFLTQILLFTSNSNWPTCYVCLGEGSSFMRGVYCIILGVYLGLHVWQRAATRGLRPILRQG